MAMETFGQDRYLPEGDWERTTDTVNVSGLQQQRGNAQEFVKAVKAAEKKRLEYGVELELEPDNRSDPNAIKVIGFAEAPGWFGRSSFGEWHIGYLDRDLAKALHTEILAGGREIAAELEAIQVNNGKLDIRLAVIVPGSESEIADVTAH